LADGNDYNLLLLKDQGQPVEVVYATEGSPLIIVPSGVFRSAPNPNAARLFQSFFFSAEGQQLLVDTFAHRSFHAQIKEKPGHPPLSSLRLLKSDPAAVLAQSEEIPLRQTFQGMIDCDGTSAAVWGRREPVSTGRSLDVCGPRTPSIWNICGASLRYSTRTAFEWRMHDDRANQRR
jgi:ABC-type Fe3+ transport system substrate-binding protein